MNLLIHSFRHTPDIDSYLKSKLPLVLKPQEKRHYEERRRTFLIEMKMFEEFLTSAEINQVQSRLSTAS